MRTLFTSLLALSSAALPALAFPADPTGVYIPGMRSALPAADVYNYNRPTKTCPPDLPTATPSPFEKNEQRLSGKKRVLYPAVHWDTDVDSLDHLIPNKNLTMFWSQHGTDPTVPQHIARGNYTLNHKSVYLGHSARVKDVTCSSDDRMSIRFQDQGAYNCAKRHWPECREPEGEELFLSGFYEGCGDHYRKGQRSWSLVNELHFDDDKLEIHCKIQHMSLEDALHSADLQFGKYIPDEAVAGTATPTYDYGKWGDSFDAELDDKIGYSVIPQVLHAAMITPAPKFDKRWSWNPIANIKSAVQKVTSFVKEEVAVATSVVKQLNPLGTHGFNLPDINPAINLGPGRDQTPWGEAGNFIVDVSNIQAYCVGCKFHGQAHFGGNIQFAIPDLIRGKIGGNLDFSGSLDMQLALGIHADAPPSMKVPWEVAQISIFNEGIPEISIPGVFEIGPYIDLSFIPTLGLMLKGDILAGFHLTIPNVQASANLADLSKSTSSGWDKYTFTPIFKVDGNFTVSANFGLPLSLNFGINIMSGKFERAVALIERPSIQFSVSEEVHLEADLHGEIHFDNTKIGGSGSCKGANLGFSVQIDTLFQIKGFPISFNLLHIPIYEKNWCWNGGVFLNDANHPDGVSVGGMSSGLPSPPDNIDSIIPHKRAAPAPVWKREPFDLSKLEPSQQISDHLPPPLASKRQLKSRRSSDLSGQRSAKLVSADGQFFIASNENGNLYAFPTSAEYGSNNATTCKWQTTEDVVTTDFSGRALYMYKDEYKHLGVSRLRLADPASGVPNGAEDVSLAPVPGLVPETYVAAGYANGAGSVCEVMFTLVCLYKEDKQPPKVFLAKDIQNGMQTLADPKNADTLTGGEVDTCMFMQWHAQY